MDKQSLLNEIIKIVDVDYRIDENTSFQDDAFDSFAIFNIFLLLRNNGYKIDISVFSKDKTVGDVLKLIE